MAFSSFAVCDQNVLEGEMCFSCYLSPAGSPVRAPAASHPALWDLGEGLKLFSVFRVALDKLCFLGMIQCPVA